ncbi:uncharacterized protein [Solanum tuberosum]|uniref:uncharacterized protein n=1 Tax=Solanum tuberosum TaxID=4113 RepID=UPI000739FF6C|nr:PREDICTED: uncharacterized protein LOC107060561 [Solanum tuberosum]
MCSPSIQKDIVDSCAKETIKFILEDLNENYFGILVDESNDISHKEQMTLVLKYVNKEGEVIAICWQGYDGASNMQGELNDLKTKLILNETPMAYRIHCFAHQLQLTLVALAEKDSNVDDFFCLVINVLNIVGASFKRRDLLRKYQGEKLEELLLSGEVHIGQGLNQECGLQGTGDTRWGTHYRTLDNIIVLFSSVIHVLEFTGCERPNNTDRLVAKTLVDTIKKFDFAFMLHLM